MSKQDVLINQLHSGSDVYFNVDTETYGSLSIWATVHHKPTYLLMDGGICFTFISFENSEFAVEWFDENGRYWKQAWEICDGGIISPVDMSKYKE